MPGVLMVNTKTRTAVWFQHSVPGFLTDADKGYKYPGNGYTNGQFLLCLSMKFADVDTIDIFSTEINKLANDSIICQSWLLGRVERLPPYTGKHHVNDVEDTYLDIGVPGEPLKIRYSKDHSKWCVAVKKPFFCFVTLNRVMLCSCKEVGSPL
ncbi:deoxyribonuclease-2-alpha-like [Amblyomma americanum]